MAALGRVAAAFKAEVSNSALTLTPALSHWEREN